MGILEIPIELVIFDDKYNKDMEEYNLKMEEYYDAKQKYDEDDILSKIQNDTLEKPKLPEPKNDEGILKIKDDLLLGYEIVKDKIYLLLDSMKINTPEYNYYITKKDDKIIEKLDNILENN